MLHPLCHIGRSATHCPVKTIRAVLWRQSEQQTAFKTILQERLFKEDGSEILQERGGANMSCTSKALSLQPCADVGPCRLWMDALVTSCSNRLYHSAVVKRGPSCRRLHHVSARRALRHGRNMWFVTASCNSTCYLTCHANIEASLTLRRRGTSKVIAGRRLWVRRNTHSMPTHKPINLESQVTTVVCSLCFSVVRGYSSDFLKGLAVSCGLFQGLIMFCYRLLEQILFTKLTTQTWWHVSGYPEWISLCSLYFGLLTLQQHLCLETGTVFDQTSKQRCRLLFVGFVLFNNVISARLSPQGCCIFRSWGRCGWCECGSLCWCFSAHDVAVFEVFVACYIPLG